MRICSIQYLNKYAFRALIETESHNMLQTGHIGPQDKKAIEFLNTHSSAIADDYYTLHRVEDAVTRGMKVFTKVRQFQYNSKYNIQNTNGINKTKYRLLQGNQNQYTHYR